jgi:hypothetical protein
MTLACAMQISKARKEVCKAGFRKMHHHIKEASSRNCTCLLANCLLFFADQYVSIIIARSDTKSCFMAIRPSTFLRVLWREKAKMHRWGEPWVTRNNEITQSPSAILQD